ncbi:hypothetical protein P7D22_04275 [Lichenihabitans sp. Uapishka_5]|uniref:hypothetical protein n=1 Tax=Lichenihabitans sp. Uapishka_5 TaxID=3037302 RepID=UPI0029E7FB0F|nr:hypothetical protein [Lichenihabitans sp. Uapishka_5]MDX7950394.1 hypothetical protein [Lichenihabitans sp. Uapishka_5]
MGIEAAGIVTLGLGLLALRLGSGFALAAFVPLTLLGAAAAVLLGGSGTIQPAHLMLGFAVPAAWRALDRDGLRTSLRFPNEGFWLVAFTVTTTLGAILLPRLLAGATAINAIGSTDYGPSLMLVPLGPTSGNLTQSIYGIADLVCFLLCAALAGRPQGYRLLARALTSYCALNIGFALLDLATYWTNTAFLFGPVRNADYHLHTETVVTGLKRIVGSFTETASFAYATLGALGFSAELWLAGVRPRLFAPLALMSLLLLTLSTSSTAYVATPLLLAALLARLGLRATQRRITLTGAAVLLLVPVLMAALLTGVLLVPAARDAVADTLTALLFDKAGSQSGLERAQWNIDALRNAIDTAGFGAGLGSVRASSFPVALLANTGVPGTLLFSGFLVRLLLTTAAPDRGAVAAIRDAARLACLGLLLGATVSGAMVDLGLPFFIFAALASARVRPALATTPAIARRVAIASPWRVPAETRAA